MKKSFVFALIVLLICIHANAVQAKLKYKAKVLGGTTNAEVGDNIEFTINPDSVTVTDKTQCYSGVTKDNRCADADQGVVIGQFPLTSITELVAGKMGHFLGITWVMDGQKATLVFESSEKDYESIAGPLELATGIKRVNADSQTNDRPRILLLSQSYGNQQGAFRNQSMEMAADLRKLCPAVVVTINSQKADFTVLLNHIETAVDRDNQIQIYNKDGDLISAREGGSIKDEVKGVCALVTVEWVIYRH